MKRTITALVILLLVTITSYANSSLPWIELILHPAQETEAAKKYRLLPIAQEQTDNDAVPLYQKAIQSLPDDSQLKIFTDWRKISPDQLPVQQVQAELKKLKSTIDLVTQATRCKQCDWPLVKPEEAQQLLMDDLKKYRQLAFILDAQSKLQIYQGQYDQVIETIKTGFAMAKHLGDAPNLIQGSVGISIAALNLKRIEQIIQADKAPNLYWALEDLPHPFVDITKAIKYETDNLKNYNFLMRRAFEKQLKPAHDRIRKQMNHIDRKIAALHCIEALRLYAGSNDGKFPDKLSEVTKYNIPKDPVTKELFSYTSTGSEAVLELEGTEGSDGRDSVRYELILKK